jgi:TorA maturation chaperone TorD
MPEEDLEAATASADLCRFIAACYYQPGPEFSEENLFESMAAAAKRLDARLAEHVRHMAEDFEATGHEQLLLDYTRLFLGPTEAVAQPYESVWTGPTAAVMGKSTVSVLELYREGGFDIDPGFRDLPDHIACELEFLYLQLFREGQARAQEDDSALASATALRRRLLDGHLRGWVFRFSAAVAAGAQSVFYRELAGLTDRFVQREMDRVNPSSTWR